jgi:PAS domain S-box-containing protein
MRPWLNLQQKGLILVAVPLLFELVFVGLLIFLQNQSERASEKVMRSKAICIAAENVINSSYDEASAFALFLVAKTPSYAERYQLIGNKINKQLRELQELVKNDRVQRSNYQKLAQESVETNGLMESIKHTLESQASLHDSLEIAFIRRKVHQHLNSLFAASSVIIKEEEQKNLKLPLLAETAKKTEQHWLYFGIFINILLSLSLAIYFSKDITNRIAKIVNDAISLVKGKELSPPLEGGDEIAELDLVLHTVGKMMQEAARREAAIINNVQDTICAINSNLRFTRVSPAAKKLWGCEQADLLNERLTDLLPEYERAKFIDKMNAAIKNDPYINFEIQMHRRDGSLVWVNWSGYWSTAENEFFCVAHDIDERKKLDQLKQDFVSMISHDLRSPLTAVNLFFHMLGEGKYGKLTEQGAKLSKKVEISLIGIVRLLNDLLDVEKFESGLMQLRQEQVTLSKVINDALDLARPFADQQQIKLLQVEREDCQLFADGSRLSQVVHNLIANAIKFSPPHSEIEIFQGTDAHGQAEVRVKDHGPGIAPGDKDFVFDRFRQLSNSNSVSIKGSGLGLTICKAIVEQHLGTIGVDSHLGEGSTFWFKLPISKDCSKEESARV